MSLGETSREGETDDDAKPGDLPCLIFMRLAIDRIAWLGLCCLSVIRGKAFLFSRAKREEEG